MASKASNSFEHSVYEKLILITMLKISCSTQLGSLAPDNEIYSKQVYNLTLFMFLCTGCQM